MAGLTWRSGLLEKPVMPTEAGLPEPGMRPNWVTIMLAQVAYSSLQALTHQFHVPFTSLPFMSP